MANKIGVSGLISGKWNPVTKEKEKQLSGIKRLVPRFLNLAIGFWMTALKITGICPLYAPSAKPFGFAISAFGAYLLVFISTSVKSLHLFAITIPLFVNNLTGSLEIFIQELCSKQGELLAFISGILFLVEWRNITTSIFRIRRFEAAYFSQPDPCLFGLLSLAVVAVVSVWLTQVILIWNSSGGFGIGAELEFCANVYGFEKLPSMPVFRNLFLAFHVINTIPMNSIIMLCAMVAMISGRLCFRMKHHLRFHENEDMSDRIIQDLLDIRNSINNLSRQIGTLLLIFYIQSVLWMVFVINNIPNASRSLSVGSLVRNISSVVVVALVVTFAMIYASDQADIAQDVQEQAVQEVNPSKRKKLIGFLHLASYSPAGFSLAGIIVIDRAFVGAMVGVLFTYGTFVLQLRESRSESAASPSYPSAISSNKSINRPSP